MKIPSTVPIAALLLILVHVVNCHAHEDPELFVQPSAARFLTLQAETLLPPTYKQAAILGMNTSVTDDLKSGSTFKLNVMGIKNATVRLSPMESPSQESKVWRGQFDGGHLTLLKREGAALKGNQVVRESITVGSLCTDDGDVIQIKSIGKNLLLFRALNLPRMPGEAEPLVPNVELKPAVTAHPQLPATTARSAFYVFDVAVFYTAAARDGAGGTSQIRATIDLAVAETNIAYRDSGINASLRLVHVAETDDDERGGVQAMLPRLQSPSDGAMDEVHQRRNQHRADFVALICEDTSFCGIAYRMTTESPTFEAFAFSVTSRVCATGNFTFAHELGHNMGCCHDAANPCVNPIAPYAFGWHFDVGAVENRTIMALSPGRRIQRFSNPNRDFTGVATGDPQEADNARVIRETANTVVAFRESRRCQDIAAEINPREQEIRLLQEELRSAPPSLKPFLVREIRRLKGEIAELEREADRAGCRLP